MQPTNYDALAGAYARGRKPFPSVIENLIKIGNLSTNSSVLEIGCGTGNHISAMVSQLNCKGWGVEPSSGMLSHTHPDLDIQFLQGPAEHLPLENDLFDLVFTVDVIHHIQGKSEYFKEALRVLKPGGIVCTVTETHEMLKDRTPQSDYFYASALADMKRYPPIEDLKTLMFDAAFSQIKEFSVSDIYEVSEATSYREKAYSSLLLISDEEFQTGLEKLVADLANGPIAGKSERLCLWGISP